MDGEQQFEIRYRNTQGTLLRILLTASRRGLDIPYVRAEPATGAADKNAGGALHAATLRLRANAKQTAQLHRDWRAIPDVLEVR